MFNKGETRTQSSDSKVRHHVHLYSCKASKKVCVVGGEAGGTARDAGMETFKAEKRGKS